MNRLRKSNPQCVASENISLTPKSKIALAFPSDKGEGGTSTPQHLLFQTYHSHAKQTPADPSKSFLFLPTLAFTNRVCKCLYRELFQDREKKNTAQVIN